ncbi:hypothetical protein [Legionella gresilensis]|uniref:hypothetical protein n=1 Tax=Legionella gresilensis TaxID=91823 RepID=UPI0013EFB605|nr:hypothetical protein [Legionella gresilensis]
MFINSSAQKFLRYIEDQQKKEDAFRDNLRKQSTAMAKALEVTIWPYLSKRGWFLSGERLYFNTVLIIKNTINELPNLSKEEVTKLELELEDALMELTKRIISITEDNIGKIWKSRKDIIKQAFWAHQEGLYSLSIPVFLAQADGICHEIFGCHIFSNYSGNIKTKVQEILDKENNTPLKIAFLKVLTETTSLTDNIKTRNEKIQSDPLYGPLNRHAILHGEDLSYAKEANSLRCISLLSFLIMVKDCTS